MAELAVLGSPGPFKAKKKDPERMLADFELYVKAIKNLCKSVQVSLSLYKSVQVCTESKRSVPNSGKVRLQQV